MLFIMQTKFKRSMMLSKEALRLLSAIADRLGVSMSAALEIIIRGRAKSDKIT